MYSTQAWAKDAADSDFRRIEIQRNICGAEDVSFAVKYCGICHSDVHIAENHFSALPGQQTNYPCVPGHELAGVVTAVGANVTKYKIGDRVGVGCISDSCLGCPHCQAGEENWCAGNGSRMTSTYNGKTDQGHIKTHTGWTFGGYSRSMTVNQRFIISIPDGFPLEAAGPVFCAGITMYSPLCYWDADKGSKRVGIVGIGGLGQMGVQLARAMGNIVTAISTSPGKEAGARQLGADHFIVSSQPDSMAMGAKSLDLILNTVSADHDLTALLGLLARDGTVVALGAVAKPHPINQIILFRRINISGSLIGGMKDTQECLDFCSKNNIKPLTAMVTADKIPEVYEKLTAKNDQIVRYVLDIQNSL